MRHEAGSFRHMLSLLLINMFSFIPDRHRAFVSSMTTLSILCCCPLRGTSIVAVRTPNAIFIGSDSKMIDGDGGDAGRVCKILGYKGIYFGIARIWSSPAQGFSVASVATDALNSNSNLESKVTHFEKLLVHPLERLLISLRAADAARFQRELDGRSAIDTLFVGFEGGYPVLLFRSFVVRNRTSRGVTLRIKREECSRDCSEALAYVALGQHEVIDEALAENPDFWKIGFAEAIRKLINLEISAKPNFVGPPISILTIDKNGPRWIEQGACPDIASH